MNVVDQLAGISPALLVAATAVLYGCALAVRHRFALMLWAAWALVCVSLLALPAGQVTLKRARALPSTVEKAQCVGEAVARRSVWRGQVAVTKVTSCRFSPGPRARPRSAAAQQRMIRPAGKALVRLYGGKPYRR